MLYLAVMLKNMTLKLGFDKRVDFYMIVRANVLPLVHASGDLISNSTLI